MDDKKNDSEYISKIAQKIFVKSVQHNIKLTPHAYHVWYEYFMGKNQELKNEIECVDESCDNITDQEMNSIYNRYFVEELDNSLVDKVNSETQKIINNVFNDLLGASKVTTNYESRLDKYSETLGGVTKVDQVQAVVKSIIKDTQAMSETSAALKKKLDQANNQTQELKQKLQEAEKSAYTDSLTNINNRKAFDKRIGELMADFKQNQTTFSYIILDIDFFKKFNDTFGHQAGDRVLQIVGAILNMALKGMDFPARYGGEEFVILLPETEIKNAIIVAEKLRIRLASKNLKQLKIHDSEQKITASFGVSQVEDKDDIKTVMERADKALYAAKEAGRNNVKSQYDLK